MSHTATIKLACPLDNPEIMRRIIEKLHGIWYGHNIFSLGDTSQTGFGFRLPMRNGLHTDNAHPGERYWYHPIVLTDEKSIAFDAFGGHWGDQSQIELIKHEYEKEYTLHKVEIEAKNLGWLTERNQDGVIVYHPTGGQLLFTEGSVKASNFNGPVCMEAVAALGIEETDIVTNDSYNVVGCSIKQQN
jgi:hypothetical protein